MLEARGLSARTPHGTPALDAVTLFVRPEEVVAVVGPRGAGKSTLLRALVGLVPLTSGTIRLDETDLGTRPPHARIRLGLAYAPAPARVLTGLSVRENLFVGTWVRRDRRAAAADLARILARFPPLAAAARARASDLPRPARQMLALGRALMSAPRVLLLDEPLAGLEGGARSLVLEAIRAAARTGCGVVLTDADPAAAAAVAGRAYGLVAGRPVFTGSAAALAQATAFTGYYG